MRSLKKGLLNIFLLNINPFVILSPILLYLLHLAEYSALLEPVNILGRATRYDV